MIATNSYNDLIIKLIDSLFSLHVEIELRRFSPKTIQIGCSRVKVRIL